MIEKVLTQYWNNMQVEIVKQYPLFRKCKIIIHTGTIMIVDECTITDTVEEAVSIMWLETSYEKSSIN